MESIAVVKKRGRPPKAGSKREAAPAAGSPIPTIPKKRGRPTKAKGRGRPPMQQAAAAATSDNEDGGDEVPVVKIKSSGKGRGRPRREPEPVKSDNEEDDECADSAGDAPPVKQQQKSPTSAKKRKLGRPRKHQASDDGEDDDEEEERRPVGRPSTGAVNLNIVRTGRGTGRPKKQKSDEAKDGSDGEVVPKKRGRPSLNNKTSTPYVPSGRPRGRPKANTSNTADEQIDEDSVDQFEGDEEELTTVVATPKKRGRPSLSGNNAQSAGKPRGRPPKAHLDNDEDEPDSANDEHADEASANANVTKTPGARGRPKAAKSDEANGGDDGAELSSEGENLSEEQAKPTANNDAKVEKKRSASENRDCDDDEPEGGARDGSVECISDEPNWANA